MKEIQEWGKCLQLHVIGGVISCRLECYTSVMSAFFHSPFYHFFHQAVYDETIVVTARVTTVTPALTQKFIYVDKN